MKTLLYSFMIGSLVLVAACKPQATNDVEGNDTSSEVGAKSTNEAPKEKVYNVKVQTLEPQVLENSIDFTATLSAFEEVHFASASPGRINKIAVEIGNHVKKGQLIAEMDKTQLHQAKIQLENARINFQRIETLMKTNSVSEQQFDQVKTQFDAAKTNVAFLEENTTLLSPINGVVTGKYFEDGEMFSGAPNTQAGKAAIVSLMQIDPLKAIVSVSEKFFPSIYKGMEVSVKCDIYPNKEFKGDIYRIHPTIDPMSRTFKVEVLLKNSDEKLRPGMFSRVTIGLGKYETLVVPAFSIIQQEGTNEKYVFINNKGVAQRIKVTTGKRFDDKIEIITNGVKAGQQLIIAGQGNLMDKNKVKIVD